MKELLPECILPSPLYPVDHPVLKEKKIHLYVKRDDLIHPEISGNKYRKLKYNLKYLLDNHIRQVVTFGGAFSNHIHATAALCHLYDIKSVGIIRGEQTALENPTLRFCADKKMKLYFVSRKDYREKIEATSVRHILKSYPDAFVLPEGGSNAMALQGVGEIWTELFAQMSNVPDFLFASAGTGSTLGGLLASLPSTCHLLGFSSLKSGHLEEEIRQIAQYKNTDRFTFFSDYHFGGYAKTNQELIDFINTFENVTEIPLDPVYNGKALFGFFNLAENNFFPEESTVVWLHTGGLQGRSGHQYLSEISYKKGGCLS